MNSVPFYSLDYVSDSLGSEISSAFDAVQKSGWFIRGKFCQQFETAFAGYCGVKHGVGVGNGLDALTLMLRAEIELGRLQKGDEVLVPANTFIATILGITSAGLVPVLVEPDETTFNLDLSRLATACTAKTKAIMVVHLYGRLAAMNQICAFAKERNLRVFEDAAQAHGAELSTIGTIFAESGKAQMRAGAFGDAAAFSFYPTKNLGALGDAGMVVTDDDELAKVVRALGNYGSAEKYVNRYQGVNSRLDELQAALLLKKLPQLDCWNQRRREIAARYIAEIKNPAVILPKTADADHVFHIFAVRAECAAARVQLQQFLQARGIESMVHYPIPPHLQEAYCNEPWAENVHLPITEALAKQELSLPMGPHLTDAQVAQVIEAVNAFNPNAGF